MGGFGVAPTSRSLKEDGRWMIHTWSRLSTWTPETWPRIQLFGSGFGQNGSTWNCGTVFGSTPATTSVPCDIVARRSGGIFRRASCALPAPDTKPNTASRDAISDVLFMRVSVSKGYTNHNYLEGALWALFVRCPNTGHRICE